jgi:hypothetical protein
VDVGGRGIDVKEAATPVARTPTAEAAWRREGGGNTNLGTGAVA